MEAEITKRVLQPLTRGLQEPEGGCPPPGKLAQTPLGALCPHSWQATDMGVRTSMQTAAPVAGLARAEGTKGLRMSLAPPAVRSSVKKVPGP